MGHTKREMLADLDEEFAAIRDLGGITEKKPGIFYLKTVPFLHFHDSDGRRWADVKKPGGGWIRIDAAFGASAAERREFTRAVRSAHGKLASPKGKRK